MSAAPTLPEVPTTLPAFAAMFPNEAACEEYLLRVRWPDGFICPSGSVGCGGWSAANLDP